MNNNQAAIQLMTQVHHQRNINRDFFENDDKVYNKLDLLLRKCELRDVIDAIKKYSLNENNKVTITFQIKHHFAYKEY